MENSTRIFTNVHTGGGASHWSGWVEETPCSTTCGKGTVKMMRRCPLADGICQGETMKEIECHSKDCDKGV